MGTKRGVSLLCLWVTVIVVSARNDDNGDKTRIVHITQGPVVGHKDIQSNIFVFHDIPYATAPTGTDRFKAPLPPPTWQEPFDAVYRGIICPQVPSLFTKPDTVQQEDCLVTTLYVPDTNEASLPVYVYFHGGGYQIGHGNMLSPKQLIKMRDMIVVLFNYRLGVHGFLCLGTEKAPGNGGMKDQLALLRWVRRNIANFGGNPDDVTIGGGSAGSAAVDLMMLSPSARGLFNKVIPVSGSNLAAFSIQINPLEEAKEYAKTLNFITEDLFALENFFVTASYEFLNSNNFTTTTIKPNTKMGLSPCVERSTGVEMFLDDTPLNILKSGNYVKVPLLYGFANMEGLIMMSQFESFHREMNKKFSDYLPADLQFESEQQKETVAKKVKEFYFGDKTVSEDTMLSFIDYYSDVMFAYPALQSVKIQQLDGHKKIYLYLFTFTDAGGSPTGYKNYTVTGANHCAQTVAVFDGITFVTEDESTLSEEYKKIKRTTRQMWLNFITLGEPVPKESSLPAWPPMGADWSPHMSLGSTVELKGSLLRERMLFWEDIYERHYRSPKPPPAPPTYSEL